MGKRRASHTNSGLNNRHAYQVSEPIPGNRRKSAGKPALRDVRLRTGSETTKAPSAVPRMNRQAPAAICRNISGCAAGSLWCRIAAALYSPRCKSVRVPDADAVAETVYPSFAKAELAELVLFLSAETQDGSEFRCGHRLARVVS